MTIVDETSPVKSSVRLQGTIRASYAAGQPAAKTGALDRRIRHGLIAMLLLSQLVWFAALAFGCWVIFR